MSTCSVCRKSPCDRFPGCKYGATCRYCHCPPPAPPVAAAVPAAGGGSYACPSCGKSDPCRYAERCRHKDTGCRYCHCVSPAPAAAPSTSVVVPSRTGGGGGGAATPSVELISPAGACTIYTSVQTTAAEAALRLLPQVRCRCDFHGVIDLFADADPAIVRAAGSPPCVISYVGAESTLRHATRDSIIRRIAAKQVAFGVLVFTRGERDGAPATFPGTKAWVLTHLVPCAGAVFCDDGKDHIMSAVSLGLPWLRSVLIPRGAIAAAAVLSGLQPSSVDNQSAS